MLHLPIERIAELVDESATASDREHLALCASCARELVAYRKLVAIAGDERRRIAPPLTSWGSLSSALREEGLLAPAGVTMAVASRTAPMHLLRRAAAVLLLLGGGAVLGRASAGLGAADVSSFTNAPAAQADSSAANDGGARLASHEGGGFTSTQDALASLERAQRVYQMAASYLAAHDSSAYEQAPDRYRTRLAALDRTAETMQAALYEAPQDPIINQYLVATLGAREQTLRRLGTTLPVGNRLVRR